MATSDRYTRREFQRILDVTDKQLIYWERLQLVSPRKSGDEKYYDFRDLITLRTAKQLIEKGVSASRLKRSIVALHQKLGEVQSPLTELRIRSNGRDVIVEQAGMHLEPISGQILLNFDTRELQEKVRVMPLRGAAEWFAQGVGHEAAEDSPGLAAEAYRRVLTMEPGHAEALNNLAMISYEQDDMQEAVALFRRAVELNPSHAISHFNLGSVLEEMGELEKARQHLRVALRLEPDYADAHYNLAFICDRMGAYVEARRHWTAYLQLDPSSSWANYARKRLGKDSK